MEYYSAIKRKNLIHTIWTSNTLCKKPIPEDYMILFIWHSGKGKTIGRWNGSVVAWLGLGVEVTFNHKVIAQGDFGGDRTILYPVWGDCYVNPFTYWNSQNAHQEKCEFTICKFYFKNNPLHTQLIRSLRPPQTLSFPWSVYYCGQHINKGSWSEHVREGGLCYQMVQAKYITCLCA